MRKCFFVVFLFASLVCPGQHKLEYGQVKGDSSYDCSKEQDTFSSIYKIGKLCDSKNEMEIRLWTAYFPWGGELIIFSFDLGVWKAKRYSYKRGPIGFMVDETIIQPFSGGVIYNNGCKRIFDSLKNNNIFLLPDQNKLKNVNGSVDDGVEYTLSFKAGNLFRIYFFNNPELYFKNNSYIPEFRQYCNVVRQLASLFK